MIFGNNYAMPRVKKKSGILKKTLASFKKKVILNNYMIEMIIMYDQNDHHGTCYESKR